MESQNGPDLYLGLSSFRQGVLILLAFHSATLTNTEMKKSLQMAPVNPTFYSITDTGSSLASRSFSLKRNSILYLKILFVP